MNASDFQAQIGRLETVCSRCWTERDAELRMRWVEELWRVSERLDLSLFSTALGLVIESHKHQRYLPTIAHILECYEQASMKARRKIGERMIDMRPWENTGPQGCISGPKCLAGKNCIERRQAAAVKPWEVPTPAHP